MPGPGRRLGTPDTRGAILAAARAAFAERGFDRTTNRAIAAAAGVTPGLVHHFFGSKEDLFLAALDLPFDPRTVLGPAVPGPLGQLGTRVARAAVGVWEDETHREPMLAYLRTAMTNREVAAAMRHGLPQVALTALRPVVNGPDAVLRVELAMTQIAGMAVLRYAIGIEPLASLPFDEVVDRVAPAIQHHLLG